MSVTHFRRIVCWRNVLSAKYPVGELSDSEKSVDEISGQRVVGRRKVCRQDLCRRNVLVRILGAIMGKIKPVYEIYFHDRVEKIFKTIISVVNRILLITLAYPFSYHSNLMQRQKI